MCPTTNLWSYVIIALQDTQHSHHIPLAMPTFDCDVSRLDFHQTYMRPPSSVRTLMYWCCSVTMQIDRRINSTGSTRRYRKAAQLCSCRVCLPHRQQRLTTALGCICNCSSGLGKETIWFPEEWCWLRVRNRLEA